MGHIEWSNTQTITFIKIEEMVNKSDKTETKISNAQMKKKKRWKCLFFISKFK